jgi:hypothetical protein
MTPDEHKANLDALRAELDAAFSAMLAADGGRATRSPHYWKLREAYEGVSQRLRDAEEAQRDEEFEQKYGKGLSSPEPVDMYGRLNAQFDSWFRPVVTNPATPGFKGGSDD